MKSKLRLMLLTRNDFCLFVLCVIELKDFIAEDWGPKERKNCWLPRQEMMGLRVSSQDKVGGV